MDLHLDQTPLKFSLGPLDVTTSTQRMRQAEFQTVSSPTSNLSQKQSCLEGRSSTSKEA